MEQHDCNESRTLFEIHAERSQNYHRFCKGLLQQKHVVLQSTAPLQLKCFKVGNKMAIVASAPVLSNQKKQCCKIARFTDTLYTWSDKVCELFAVKALHTSLLITTMVAFKVLPLGSYAPMPAPSPPFKTILELVLWNGIQRSYYS